MHWADVLAEDLLKEDKKHVLATGITPSQKTNSGSFSSMAMTSVFMEQVQGRPKRKQLNCLL